MPPPTCCAGRGFVTNAIYELSGEEPGLWDLLEPSPAPQTAEGMEHLPCAKLSAGGADSLTSMCLSQPLRFYCSFMRPLTAPITAQGLLHALRHQTELQTVGRAAAAAGHRAAQGWCARLEGGMDWAQCLPKKDVRPHWCSRELLLSLNQQNQDFIMSYFCTLNS